MLTDLLSGLTSILLRLLSGTANTKPATTAGLLLSLPSSLTLLAGSLPGSPLIRPAGSLPLQLTHRVTHSVRQSLNPKQQAKHTTKSGNERGQQNTAKLEHSEPDTQLQKSSSDRTEQFLVIRQELEETLKLRGNTLNRLTQALSELLGHILNQRTQLTERRDQLIPRRLKRLNPRRSKRPHRSRELRNTGVSIIRKTNPLAEIIRSLAESQQGRRIKINPERVTDLLRSLVKVTDRLTEVLEPLDRIVDPLAHLLLRLFGVSPVRQANSVTIPRLGHIRQGTETNVTHVLQREQQRGKRGTSVTHDPGHRIETLRHSLNRARGRSEPGEPLERLVKRITKLTHAPGDTLQVNLGNLLQIVPQALEHAPLHLLSHIPPRRRNILNRTSKISSRRGKIIQMLGKILSRIHSSSQSTAEATEPGEQRGTSKPDTTKNAWDQHTDTGHLLQAINHITQNTADTHDRALHSQGRHNRRPHRSSHSSSMRHSTTGSVSERLHRRSRSSSLTENIPQRTANRLQPRNLTKAAEKVLRTSTSVLKPITQGIQGTAETVHILRQQPRSTRGSAEHERLTSLPKMARDLPKTISHTAQPEINTIRERAQNNQALHSSTSLTEQRLNLRELVLHQVSEKPSILERLPHTQRINRELPRLLRKQILDTLRSKESVPENPRRIQPGTEPDRATSSLSSSLRLRLKRTLFKLRINRDRSISVLSSLTDLTLKLLSVRINRHNHITELTDLPLNLRAETLHLRSDLDIDCTDVLGHKNSYPALAIARCAISTNWLGFSFFRSPGTGNGSGSFSFFFVRTCMFEKVPSRTASTTAARRYSVVPQPADSSSPLDSAAVKESPGRFSARNKTLLGDKLGGVWNRPSISTPKTLSRSA